LKYNYCPNYGSASCMMLSLDSDLEITILAIEMVIELDWYLSI
jgi:hypothetical protein